MILVILDLLFQSIQFQDVGFAANVLSATANGSPNGVLSPSLGTQIKIVIPDFSLVGTHGFSVLFYNVISSIKFDPVNYTVWSEDIQVLDPLPYGMGEWVTIMAPKWDYNWVCGTVALVVPVVLRWPYP
jgi:hypothetical protein